MARNFHRKQRLSTVSEINVTPLIDLAFSLLIIFMIAAPLLEQTIPLELPLETKKVLDDRSKIKYQTISIDHHGQYFWGTNPVEFLELNALLSDLKKDPEPPVLDIRADGRLAYQKIVDLISLVQKNELTKISLDTQVK